MSHTTVSRDHFYKEEAITNIQFGQAPTFEWHFQTNGILLSNDSLQNIEWSFNGKDVDGKVTPQDKWIALDIKRETKIWLRTSKATVGGSKLRMWAWRGEG